MESKLATLDEYVNFLLYPIYKITHLGLLCPGSPDLIEQIQLVEMTTDGST